MLSPFPDNDQFWSSTSPSQRQDAFKAILDNIKADTAMKLAEAEESAAATAKLNSRGEFDSDDEEDFE